MVVDLVALRLDPEHQARVDRAAVEDHAAGAAVAGVAAFLAAGQPQHVAQNLEQALARLAQELGPFAVDRRFYYCFVIHRSISFVVFILSWPVIR